MRKLILDKSSLIVAFLCSPVLSLWFVFTECCNNKRYAYILLSLFMGLLSMLVCFPWSDLYRHYLEYIQISRFDWSDFLNYQSLNIKMDFLLQWMEYIYSHIGLSFGFIRFTFIFVVYLLYFNIYNLYCQMQYSSTFLRRLYCLGVIMLFIPFATISNGLRFGFAISLFAYVMCHWFIFEKRNYWDYIILLLSVYTHMAILIFLFMVLLSMLMPNRLNKKIFLLILFISFQSSYLILNYSSYLPFSYELNRYIAFYTEGRYSTMDGYMTGGNIFYWILVAGPYVLLLIYFLYIYAYVPYNKQTKLIYVLFLLYGFTSSFFALNARVMHVILLVGGLYLLRYLDFKKSFIMILLIYTIGINVVQWRKYWHSHWYYLFTPIPVALTGDFSDEWVNENILPDGNPRLFNHN